MAKSQKNALIGLDGSGKSANIDKMKTDSDYDGYSFLWVRWEPKLLKPAYKLMQRKVDNTKTENVDVSSNKLQKSSEEQKKMSAQYNQKSGMKGKIFKNPIVRGVWMFLALIDYYFQFYKKTRKHLKNDENIIFDRFYLDLFVDQGINFGYSPEKIDKKIKHHQWLFPKMDKIIYLRVSPETCYKRKDDIPNMDYLLRRFDIYEQLCKNPNWIITDGELPFESVYGNIKKEILNQKSE